MPRTLANPLPYLLAVMAFQFLALAKLGPFAVTLPYAMLGLAIVYVGLRGTRTNAAIDFVQANAGWVLAYAAYLVLMTAILAGSAGFSSPVRQMFYLAGMVATAATLATLPDPRRALRIGGLAGIVLFVAVSEVLARRSGTSWIEAITRFVGQGDREFVVYGFLRPVFNEFADPNDLSVPAARKNEVAVAMLVAALSVRAGYRGTGRDWVGIAVIAFTVGLLFMLDTRSVLIVAGASFLLILAVRTTRQRASERLTTYVGLGALLALLVVAAGYQAVEGAAVDTIGERLSFDDHSTDARKDQYRAAFDSIAQNPVLGSGAFRVDGEPVHNLFLSAWVQGGFGAFLLVSGFYLALVLRWSGVVLSVMRTPRLWILPVPFEWVAPLPFLLFARVWVAGDGGHPFLGEWVALALCMGLAFANDRARRALHARNAARYAAPHPVPQPFPAPGRAGG